MTDGHPRCGCVIRNLDNSIAWVNVHHMPVKPVTPILSYRRPVFCRGRTQ